MLSKKIVISNQKGGVGKTTLLFHIGYLFARDNNKTLLVDTDPQGNLTSCFLDEIPPNNNIRLIYEKKMPDPIKIEPNLFLIGTDITLSKYEADTKLENFFLLKNLLNHLDYSVILIDTPPSLGLFTSSAFLSSDYILIPVDLSKFSLIGLVDLITSINKIKETTNSPLKIIGIVLSLVEERLLLFKKIKENLIKEYSNELFNTVISNSVRIKETIEKRKPIFDIFPDHKVSIQYKNLYEEIKGRL